MSILSIQSVSKFYEPKQHAIQNISFELQKGEILAIVGHSGSGKTTLIKILAGLLQTDAGTVFFNNKKLEGPDEKLVPGHEEIRLVHQDFKLYHNMTVEENLLNTLLQYKPAYKKERTWELLELCGLTRRKDKYVHEISGGEKQRVAIAMALATEPKVLLFDEPFSNLDLQTKTVLLQEIEAKSKSTDTSVVMITHDSRDAMEIAHKMIVLHEGQVIRQGTPQEIYYQPNHQEVANLLGLHTTLTKEQLEAFIPNPKSDFYGIWAEDVLLHKADGHQGRVKKVIFSGAVNKLLITAKGFDIWAYDYSGKVKVKDKMKFSLRTEKVFSLK